LSNLPVLTIDEKSYLLNLAREVIHNRCTGKDFSRPSIFSDNLKTKLGVFVSLHLGKELRGCIGYVRGIKSLQDAVIDMAESAAFNDPRFLPVTSSELDALTIEISVLSELERLKDTNDLQVGTDGLLIEKGIFSGLLLPQVAVEFNWDRETFLSQTCGKAGLPYDEWQSGNCTIFKFTAAIFSELDT